MQTGDTSITEACFSTYSHSIVTRLHSAFICSKIQIYDVMVEYYN